MNGIIGTGSAETGIGPILQIAMNEIWALEH